MMDEKKIEEIISANINYAKEIIPDSNLWSCENALKVLMVRCAEVAVQAFLKDLWHDAKEEPTAYKKFVYLKSNQEIGVTSLLPSFDWGNMVHNIGITYWFYLDDILSKQKGGEQ